MKLFLLQLLEENLAGLGASTQLGVEQQQRNYWLVVRAPHVHARRVF
jgi:hypothetical protein